MWDFLNQPLSGPSSLILLAVLIAIIFVAIKLGHKKARDISKQFLTEHPDAATLYFYADDLPSNDARPECIQGTISKVYDPRTVPGAKVQKDVARKHGSMQAHFILRPMVYQDRAAYEKYNALADLFMSECKKYWSEAVAEHQRLKAEYRPLAPEDLVLTMRELERIRADVQFVPTENRTKEDIRRRLQYGLRQGCRR